MAAWRYKISFLILKKYFTRSLLFSTLEENFCISAQPCNILYLLNLSRHFITHWYYQELYPEKKYLQIYRKLNG